MTRRSLVSAAVLGSAVLLSALITVHSGPVPAHNPRRGLQGSESSASASSASSSSGSAPSSSGSASWSSSSATSSSTSGQGAGSGPGGDPAQLPGTCFFNETARLPKPYEWDTCAVALRRVIQCHVYGPEGFTGYWARPDLQLVDGFSPCCELAVNATQACFNGNFLNAYDWWASKFVSASREESNIMTAYMLACPRKPRIFKSSFVPHLILLSVARFPRATSQLCGLHPHLFTVCYLSVILSACSASARRVCRRYGPRCRLRAKCQLGRQQFKLCWLFRVVVVIHSR